MSQKPYNKPALSVAEQIALLETRGIVCTDKAAAQSFFTYNNYYYVSGYTYYFEKHATQRSHQFDSPLRFESIKELVDFDQKLRQLFWQAIQPIEIALRASIARHISMSHGAFCLENPQVLRKPHLHPGLLDRLHKALNEHKNEPFISHFVTTYQEPCPPPKLLWCKPLSTSSYSTTSPCPWCCPVTKTASTPSRTCAPSIWSPPHRLRPGIMAPTKKTPTLGLPPFSSIPSTIVRKNHE